MKSINRCHIFKCIVRCLLVFVRSNISTRPLPEDSSHPDVAPGGYEIAQVDDF